MRLLSWFIASVLGLGLPLASRADLPASVATVRASVLPVGYFRDTDSPRFTLGGSGFVVEDGNLLVTNLHVLGGPLRDDANAMLVVLLRGGPTGQQLRRARVVDTDALHDLALLRFEGAAVAALALGDSDAVREGRGIALTGFPLGGTLGFSPVTHRGIVSSITPVALPSPRAGQLSEQAIARLRDGAFDMFQLDATAYPGNSGGPLYDPETAQVLGVVNMVFAKGARESALSQPSGISYAIPAKYVVQLLQRRPR